MKISDLQRALSLSNSRQWLIHEIENVEKNDDLWQTNNDFHIFKSDPAHEQIRQLILEAKKRRLKVIEEELIALGVGLC